MRRPNLSKAEARRIAVQAQGLSAGPEGVATARTMRAMLQRLGALQIDSVNVLVRAQYLPLYSRLGAYDRALLDRIVYGKPRRFFEYWGHEASYLPLELFPAMRWRMERSRTGKGVWQNVARVGRDVPKLVAAVRKRFEEEGPLSASQFEDARNREKWWGWTDTKRAVEFLFWCGELTPIGRRTSFERIYDLTSRALPSSISQQHLEEDDQFETLVERAAAAYGVATEADLRDYFRMPVAQTRSAVERLTERGTLQPVRVDGWKQQAYLHRAVRIPRASASRSALLSPFDPMVWNRERAHRLFDFHYRIEIYTPAHKRVHGYYVLPYLLDGQLVARVDLKADREARVLRVHSVHYEPAANKRTVSARLRDDLGRMAEWLGLDRVRMSR